MEKAGKRGKIPQSDWPLIMARYEQGETLSSIARTYDCSPPAISYIVSRSRGKATSETSPPAVAETQLVKTPADGAAGNGSAIVEPTVAPPAATLVRRETFSETKPMTVIGNGAEAPVDQRRTLHLSLGNGNGSTNGHHGNGNGVHPNGNGHAARPPQPEASANGNGQRPFQAPRNPPPFDAGPHGRDLFAIPEGSPSAQQPRDSDAARKDGATFIDQELRSRVDGDIAAFLAAFDAALAADTQESRFGLREATDRLLRAGARTRIELERLEARVPLSRDGGAQPQPAAWRYR